MNSSYTYRQDIKSLFLWKRDFFRLLFSGIVLLLGIQTQADAQGYYQMNQRLEQAYEHIISLEFQEGNELLKLEKTQFPDNLLVYHIENYIDFFTCFVSEEKLIFEEKEKNKDARIYYLEQGPEDSPYHLFSQAEVILQWALARLKFEEYTTAVFEINKAIKLLERNQVLFPDFIANKKSLSALHALVGTIPSQYKSILQYVSSFNGTIQQGYNEIQEVITYAKDHTFVFEKEAIAIKALIELHLLNEKDAAYQTIHASMLDAKNNPLACFLKANISHKAGHNDEALAILDAYQSKEGRYPMYYLDYLTGIYKLNRLDTDSDVYIRKYLNYFNGRNYIKEAYQKLAWYELAINNDKLAYRNNMRYAHSRGYAIVDEDKQAEKNSQNKYIPLDYLLKARLLSDGSYDVQALEMLEEHQNQSRTLDHEIEFYYRKGKIHSDLGQNARAKEEFLTCLSKEEMDEFYYQTASTLYLAQIYEKEGDFESAEKYFKICLKQNPDQYKNSLHQKAKSGLQRIKISLP